MGTDNEKEKDVLENQENVVEQTENVDTTAGTDTSERPKKSDLIREQIELEKQYESESVQMLEDTYSVKIGSKANFDKLIKMVEHEFEFDYHTATGLALLYSNLKQQKPFTREDDWNGSILLKTSSCLMMWKFISTYKGKGFFEAKAFLEMIQLIGPEVSKACNTINEKQTAVRGLHLRLDEIDNILDSGKFENDLTEEEEKALIADVKGVIKNEEKIENEVDPNVEL